MAYTPWWRKMASSLGDASYGYSHSGTVTNYSSFAIEFPDGIHSEITLTGWYAHTSTNNLFIVPWLFYTPDTVQYSNPDLLNGAWAHGVEGGTNLVTSFSFNGFPFSTYTNHPDITNTWRWGVYTVDGWSSNAVTLNLGGIDSTIGPGSFKQNFIAGGSGDCILTGTGLVSIGISKTPCHRFYNFTKPLTSADAATWTFGIWSTNEISFISIRIRANGTNHVATLKLRVRGQTWSEDYVATNACSSLFSSGGIYRMQPIGIYNNPTKAETTFDYRTFSYFLTDDELERVYQNGADETIRRNL
jgi:hypothetical protein